MKRLTLCIAIFVAMILGTASSASAQIQSTVNSFYFSFTDPAYNPGGPYKVEFALSWTDGTHLIYSPVYFSYNTPQNNINALGVSFAIMQPSSDSRYLFGVKVTRLSDGQVRYMYCDALNISNELQTAEQGFNVPSF